MSRWGNVVEGRLKRLGAVFLTFCGVLLTVQGIGLVLYGISTRVESGQWQEPLSIGVGIVTLGGVTWYLARRLNEEATRARARRDENQVLRLARERGGRLTAMDAAAETGLTAVEAEQILRGLAEGGFVEIEVTDAGIMVYRFPDVLFDAGGATWSRRAT